MLLPWFNKYVSTDFHELNIDWLCTAYKDFIEQLQAFDNRLTGIETNVDTRLTTMEGRIDDQDQTIADFKEEVNTRFRELADSIAQQFTDLETEFNGKFDDLEQSINDQFTQLSGDIDERITQFENDITGRLDDFEEAIDARMDTAEDNIIALQDTDKQIRSSMLTQGLLNLYPQEEKTYFPDHSAEIVVNMVGGKISAEGTPSEDLTVTLAGGPNEIPYGWNTSYDTLFNYRFMRAGVVASPTLTVDVILYVGGVESRRSTFTGGGAITIMESEMATLSGIEIKATAAAGITYNANYIPYIIPMAIGSNISNMQPTTFPELIGRVGSALTKINANNVDADKMQGRNMWMVNMVSNTSDGVDGLTITVGYDGVVLHGTAAADIDYDTIIKLTPDTSKIYHIIFHTDIGSTAVKFKLHNADNTFVKIYDPAMLYEEQFASADQLTLALLIPTGTYNYQDDIYYPSCSTISSNLELMDDVEDLQDRVEDIEDEFMGETTYGPDDEVTFTDPVGDVPLKEIISEVNYNQTNDYDKVWSPGRGKNYIDVTDGSYSAGDTLWSGSLTLAAGTYTLSGSNTTSDVAVLGVGSGTMPYTFTLAADTTITGIQAVQAGTFNNVMLEDGSSATTFEPYSNVCNITGNDEITLTINGVDHTISLPDTYYGADANITAGTGTIRWAFVEVPYATLKNYAQSYMAFDTNYIGLRSFFYDLIGTCPYTNRSKSWGGYFGISNVFNVKDINNRAFYNSQYWTRLNQPTRKINNYSEWQDYIDELEAANIPIQFVFEFTDGTPTTFSFTPSDYRTVNGTNTISSDTGKVTITTQSFVESLIEKFTERFIITYNSGAGTVDKTYNEIYEAYIEGRRLCFYDGILITELNQFDETNGVFHWEYNEFTATGIDFYEMLIDINGVTVSSKSVTI